MRKSGKLRLDLAARRGAPVLLGTVVEDPEARRLSRVFYDPDGPAIVQRDEELVAAGSGWKVELGEDVPPLVRVRGEYRDG